MSPKRSKVWQIVFEKKGEYILKNSIEKRIITPPMKAKMKNCSTFFTKTTHKYKEISWMV
jgi:hypothetical protein